LGRSDINDAPDIRPRLPTNVATLLPRVIRATQRAHAITRALFRAQMIVSAMSIVTPELS
jgi:hypothetical protein